MVQNRCVDGLNHLSLEGQSGLTQPFDHEQVDPSHCISGTLFYRHLQFCKCFAVPACRSSDHGKNLGRCLGSGQPYHLGGVSSCVRQQLKAHILPGPGPVFQPPLHSTNRTRQVNRALRLDPSPSQFSDLKIVDLPKIESIARPTSASFLIFFLHQPDPHFRKVLRKCHVLPSL